jgi:hypothetical protein
MNHIPVQGDALARVVTNNLLKTEWLCQNGARQQDGQKEESSSPPRVDLTSASGKNLHGSLLTSFGWLSVHGDRNLRVKPQPRRKRMFSDGFLCCDP